AHAITTAALRPASSSAVTNPTRTALLTALTGGLSTTMTPTDPSTVRVTGDTNEVPYDQPGHRKAFCAGVLAAGFGLARGAMVALTPLRHASMLSCDRQTRSRGASSCNR